MSKLKIFFALVWLLWAATAHSAVRPLRFQNTDRLLILAPHPDDEVLGSAGVILEAKRRHLPVRIVFLTVGDKKPRPKLSAWQKLKHKVLRMTGRETPEPHPELKPGQVRHGEALAADAVLGVIPQEETFLGFPDGGTF